MLGVGERGYYRCKDEDKYKQFVGLYSEKAIVEHNINNNNHNIYIIFTIKGKYIYTIISGIEGKVMVFCSGLTLETMGFSPLLSAVYLYAFSRVWVSNFRPPSPTPPHEVEYSLGTPHAESTDTRPGTLAENRAPILDGGWV